MTEHAEGNARDFADLVVDRAMRVMEGEGIPFNIIMDRMLTAAAAQIASHDGAAVAAQSFRAIAISIDAGALDAVAAKTGKH